MSYASKKKSIAIADLASGVIDNGRRGQPRPGCDCVQCFGYCLVDGEKAERDSFERADQREAATEREEFA